MAILQSTEGVKWSNMANFGRTLTKQITKKHAKNNSRTKLDLLLLKKAAGKNKQYSENDKILKTRKMTILQRL